MAGLSNGVNTSSQKVFKFVKPYVSIMGFPLYQDYILKDLLHQGVQKP
jgi:hypothetical protein